MLQGQSHSRRTVPLAYDEPIQSILRLLFPRTQADVRPVGRRLAAASRRWPLAPAFNNSARRCEGPVSVTVCVLVLAAVGRVEDGF